MKLFTALTPVGVSMLVYIDTASAEKKNAENVTFMSGPCVADQYRINFEKRWKVARPYPGKVPHHRGRSVCRNIAARTKF